MPVNRSRVLTNLLSLVELLNFSQMVTSARTVHESISEAMVLFTWAEDISHHSARALAAYDECIPSNNVFEKCSAISSVFSDDLFKHIHTPTQHFLRSVESKVVQRAHCIRWNLAILKTPMTFVNLGSPYTLLSIFKVSIGVLPKH
ncbi:hypothetical protein TNCV_1819001 [Trichonephila clavipes]|nr:hypothetical protein TNCV_1819001 [Trichonephila clavipes]